MPSTSPPCVIQRASASRSCSDMPSGGRPRFAAGSSSFPRRRLSSAHRGAPVCSARPFAAMQSGNLTVHELLLQHPRRAIEEACRPPGSRSSGICMRLARACVNGGLGRQQRSTRLLPARRRGRRVQKALDHVRSAAAKVSPAIICRVRAATFAKLHPHTCCQHPPHVALQQFQLSRHKTVSRRSILPTYVATYRRDKLTPDSYAGETARKGQLGGALFCAEHAS